MRARLQLDFVAPAGRSRLAGSTVLILSLVLAGGLVFKYRETQQRLQQLAAAEALLSEAGPARAQEGKAQRARLDEQMKSAQATVRQLALPWPQLIDSLERAALKEVAVLDIQPDAQSRVVRVTASATQERAMLAYLRRLGNGFAEVHLLSHQVREDEPQRPIQFAVQARFRDSP